MCSSDNKNIEVYMYWHLDVCVGDYMIVVCKHGLAMQRSMWAVCDQVEKKLKIRRVA